MFVKGMYMLKGRLERSLLSFTRHPFLTLLPATFSVHQKTTCSRVSTFLYTAANISITVHIPFTLFKSPCLLFALALLLSTNPSFPFLYGFDICKPIMAKLFISV